MALVASILATTACQKDNADDAWRQIPVEQISVESGNAAVTVNDVTCSYGEVLLVADSKDAGTLTLTGIVPGYSEVKMKVDLRKKSDDSFSFQGSTIVSTPPSVAATLRSTDDNPCYAFRVEGTVKLDGTISMAVTTQVQGSYAASLTGSWNVTRKCKVDQTGTPVGGPVQVTWKAAGAAAPAVAKASVYANIFGCLFAAELMDQVTFDETGNITARYWAEPDLGDDPMATLKQLAKMIKPDADGNVTFSAHHTDWETSPKANLVFWYAMDNALFIVPNVSAIIDAADAEETRTDIDGIDMSSVIEILATLKALGVDVDALNTELQKVLTRGIEYKYTVNGQNLKIYVDKELCAPVIDALLPVLPTLDAVLEQLAQSHDPEDIKTLQTIKKIMDQIGLQKPSDLGLVWKATTEFEIAYNFAKA